MRYLLFTMLAVVLTACSLNNPPPITPTAVDSAGALDNQPPVTSPAPAAEQPSAAPPTMEEELIGPNNNREAYEGERPLAARVNGEPIYLDIHVKQVGQLQQALAAQETENNTDTDPGKERLAQIRQQVLNTLVDQAIIEQAAAKAGIVVSEETIDAKIQESITQGGGEAQFEAWLAANNLTTAEFKERLHAELLAGQIFGTITADIPETAEQVEMSQILVADDTTAWAIIEQLKQGAEFAQLVQEYSIDESSRANGGNLGWFPRNLGLVPAEVEEVAFSIEPGQVSGPIQSPLGFHIIKLENRAAERPLEGMRQVLQQQLFMKWLTEQRSLTNIEVYVEF